MDGPTLSSEFRHFCLQEVFLCVVDDLLGEPRQLGDFDAEALVGATLLNVVEESELSPGGDGVHVAVEHGVRKLVAEAGDLVEVGGEQADGTNLGSNVPANINGVKVKVLSCKEVPLFRSSLVPTDHPSFSVLQKMNLQHF